MATRTSGEPPRRSAPCAVCGSEDLATDEVFERGLWHLGECRRCHHRWTVGPLASVGPAPAIWRVEKMRRPGEDAAAA